MRSIKLPREDRSAASRPLKVAQVCGISDGGLWMVQISLGLKQRGFDVVAIIGADGGGTASALRRAEIPFIVMPQPIRSASRIAGLIGRLPMIGSLRGVIDAVALLRNAAKMARILRVNDIDVVHSHLFPSMMIARLAGFFARVPIRVSMVANPLHLEYAWSQKLDLLTHRLDDRILAGCQYTNDLYANLGVRVSKRTTVGYGIDPHGYDPTVADGPRVRRELGISESVPVVGQVAFFYSPLRRGVAPDGADRLGIKGHEDLMAAAVIVLDHRPDVRFLVVGDGFDAAGRRHFEDIKRLAHTLGIDHSVIFPGRRSDLTDVIAAMDVSLQCSIMENYGGTIESLLMERPMVATRAGGMPETVVDGETGLLVDVRDPVSLAEAILRLLGDHALAQRLGRAGRQRMLERHTIHRTIDGVEQVYREIATAKGLLRPPLQHRRHRDGALTEEPLGLMPRHVLFTEP
jgi:glycosyltransferase involved in cell wall biosynthesis